ncbi:SpoIIE family protein phosphatase [Streptomyces sp. NPDC051561]|uniref:SpoIIE family protein phosphatase n=1 Tax=Streptomyces sp. NPDC051561 TaxID=3365658 RepID=UPI003789900A
MADPIDGGPGRPADDHPTGHRAAEDRTGEGWPVRPERGLALNRMGIFDWDLDQAHLYLDASALDLFDVLPDEYDGSPRNLSANVAPAEGARMDGVVSRALKSGESSYGIYFRVRRRDGELRWTHTQGSIRRDATGRPYRIIGVVRDAAQEIEDFTARSRYDTGNRGGTGVVAQTTAALAHARSVRDVIDVLRDTHDLGSFESSSLVMGLVEAGRIRLVAEGPEFMPGSRYTRVDDPEFPMSDVVRSLRPRFIESAQEFAASYPRLWDHVRKFGSTSAAYLPLIAQGRAIGALGLLYSGRTGFSSDERNLLIALGSSIAQSVQRAMLYEQEKDLAEGLQQAMLPRRVPVIPGAHVAVRYSSARDGQSVGGDWYDVIPLPGGRVGAVVGDVQGHDTHAAAVMGQLRIALRAYAAEGHAPATVMARASAFLHDLDTERFATCTYAEVELTTGAVQLVRAGHMEPLVRLADGSCRRMPVEGGLPLGLSAEFAKLEYPVTSGELDPGQTLLLYSDGLVEQPGCDLDEGLDTLIGLITDAPRDIQQLADRLCASADERGGADDVALLLLCRRAAADAPRAGGRLQQHVAPNDPEALSEARRTIRAAVRAWGAGGRADEIELVADEMMVNALMHTDGGAVLTLRMLTAPERRLRVEVADSSSALPRRREAGDAAVSGRGLLLVDRLADVWGVEPRGAGKALWCEFGVPLSSKAAREPENP